MEQYREDETVADLLNIKGRIEKSIANFQEEKERVKQRLNSIHEQKIAERKKKSEEYIKNIRLKIALSDSQKRIATREAYMTNLTTIMDGIEARMNQKMRLQDFEQPILQLNSAIEGAISFYSEESLQMELMKRSNAVRERRVEYTRLESEVNDLTRRLEEKKREEERAKMAELEKARQDEEQAKKFKEAKAEEEQAKLREHYHELSIKPIESIQSFLGNIISSSTNFNGFAKPRSVNSNSPIIEPEAPSVDQGGENQVPTSRASDLPEISFSQLLRW